MTAAAPSADHGAHGAGEHHEEHIHEASHYVRIWAILCVLLIISFLGPIVADKIGMTGIGRAAVVLMTAFGIALVKAYFVCAKFMHLDIEKRLAAMIIGAALICMGLFFAGAGADVMKHEGDEWVNVAAKAETARRIEREGEHGDKMNAALEEKEKEEKGEKGEKTEKTEKK